MADVPQNDWSQSVVRVGDGRGLVIETEREDRFVITAGHCLPGVVSTGAGPNPQLVANLPGWILRSAIAQPAIG
jgi:hypothetical protein